MSSLEERVTRWRMDLARAGVMEGDDAEELESHLWDLIDADLYAGCPPEEAFTRACARMGRPEPIADEFGIIYKEMYMELENRISDARDNPEELEILYHQKPQAFASCVTRALEKNPESSTLLAWKARLSYAPFRADRKREIREIAALVIACAAAVLAARLPALWGADVITTDAGANSFFLRNFAFMFLPMIGFLYAFRLRPPLATVIAMSAVFAVSAVAVNVMPAFPPYQTRILSAVHLPLLSWLAVGLVHTGADWRSPTARLDYLRATGEIFIYTVLILLGGAVLSFFTLEIFGLIKLNITTFYMANIAFVGACAAPIVASHITERKREIVESFAPVLSAIFTPLVLVTLVVFLVTMLAVGKSPYNDRDFLLVFNGMLVLVIALIFFNVTERKLGQRARIMDALNAVLILAALAVDGVALSAIIVRITSYGVSANKIAVLGENVLLLTNLLGLGVQYVRHFTGRTTFAQVENVTARLLPVYFIWIAVVVFAFPAVFSFL